MHFVVMEDLLDKLKLLNYEEEFVAELRQVHEEIIRAGCITISDH